jgi:hypothetical protein
MKFRTCANKQVWNFLPDINYFFSITIFRVPLEKLDINGTFDKLNKKLNDTYISLAASVTYSGGTAPAGTTGAGGAGDAASCGSSYTKAKQNFTNNININNSYSNNNTFKIQRSYKEIHKQHLLKGYIMLKVCNNQLKKFFNKENIMRASANLAIMKSFGYNS